MKKKVLSILLAALTLLPLLCLCGCDRKSQRFSTYSFDYFNTATTVIGFETDQATFDQTSATILAELEEYHRLYTIYHRFEGLENLCTINELKSGAHRTVTVDRRIIDMLLYAKEAYDMTGGLVNVAMGSVLSIWHDYRTLGSEEPWNAALPPMDELIEAAKHTDIANMVIDEENCTVMLTDPAMTLDVGAIAKGFAVEMVARSMEQKGISGYVLNVGGNVRTIGTKPDGTPWTVGIENPMENASEPYLAQLYLSGESLVTSGSYQRYYTVDGKDYHHIIHPDTLMPAQGLLSVSVVCQSSALGDALSTALFCMSVEDGMALVASLPDVEATWLTADGAQYFSDGFAAYTKS